MKIIELLKYWMLQKRVFTVTVDNASSNDNIQLILKRQFRRELVCNEKSSHVRCATHILDLIVQDGLSVVDGALDKIRNKVKFMKANESR